MKKRIFSYALLSVFLFLFFSCSNEDTPSGNKTKIPVEISAYIDNTYLIGSKTYKTSFDKDDLIGVYLVDYVNNQPNTIGSINNFMNSQYIYTGSYWHNNDGDNIYLTDNNSVADLYAYSPYDYEMSRAESKRNLQAYPFNVETNQTLSPEKSDFLWSKYSSLTASNANASLAFEHLLSKIIINVNYNNKSINNSLYVHNLKKEGLIDLNTGNVTSNGDEYIFTPYLESTANNGYDATYSIIVIPQSVLNTTSLFSVQVDEQILTFQIDHDLTFQRGTEYTFNLIVGEANSTTRSGLQTYSISLQSISHY